MSRAWADRLWLALLCLAVILVSRAPGPALAGQQPTTPAPPAGLDLYMPPGEASPEDSGLVALGRALFHDPALSTDSTFACASCHRPERAFAGDERVSVGVFGRRGTRNVPTLINRGWGEAFFWDGRIETLEEQVLQPILAPAEMDMTVDEVVARLARNADYRKHFEDHAGGAIDGDALARALAAYVRTIRAGDSRFDRFTSGRVGALDEQERRGLELFQGRARCSRCHLGSLLTDESFHNTGVAWRAGEPTDSGRALVTGRPEDVGAFKTPTLREVTRTAPYMHDGSLATLEEVVDFYSDGGRANPHLDPLVRRLELTDEEKEALVAFLATLEGRIEEGGQVVAR